MSAEQDFLEKFKEEIKLHVVTFMEHWYKFDSDKSGFLSTKELKDFLKTLGVNPEKLESLTAKIIELYDSNNDGKLALSEMSKLMLSEDGNILKKFIEDENLTKEKFDDIFDHYDLDRNGLIEGSELIAFLRDMRDTQDEDSETKDLEQYKKWIMDQADENKDDKLSKDELRKLFFG